MTFQNLVDAILATAEVMAAESQGSLELQKSDANTLRLTLLNCVEKDPRVEGFVLDVQHLGEGLVKLSGSVEEVTAYSPLEMFGIVRSELNWWLDCALEVAALDSE